MARIHSISSSPRKHEASRRARGFSLIEVSVVMAVIGIVTTIGAGIVMGKVQEARLERCRAELRAIQSKFFSHFADDSGPLDEQAFWDQAWNGADPVPYRILSLIGGANEAQGNDRSGGASVVILCRHDHGSLAKYQYVIDEGEPSVATEFDDPGYAGMLDARNLGPGDGEPRRN